EVSLEHRRRSPYLPAATAGFVEAAGAVTATGWPDPADALRGHSSVGRALEWHSRGRGFDSPWLHQSPDDPSGRVTVFPCRAERYSPGEAQDLVVAMPAHRRRVARVVVPVSHHDRVAAIFEYEQA